MEIFPKDHLRPAQLRSLNTELNKNKSKPVLGFLYMLTKHVNGAEWKYNLRGIRFSSNDSIKILSILKRQMVWL